MIPQPTIESSIAKRKRPVVKVAHTQAKRGRSFRPSFHAFLEKYARKPQSTPERNPTMTPHVAHPRCQAEAFS
jgi:hypothetical protein